MKPKTKLQKFYYNISQTIPEITDKQKTWAIKHVVDRYYTIMRNRHYCLECNYKWLRKMTKGIVMCPQCNNKLSYTPYCRYMTIYGYFGILSVSNYDIQVVRVFYIQKTFTRLNKPVTFISEVMRHFITIGRHSITLSKLGGTFHSDRWRFGTDIEPRINTMSAAHRERIVPDKYYPGRAIHPILRRNGFKGIFYDLAPKTCLEALLMDDRAETLLKAGQIDLFRMRAIYKEKINKIWPSIKICIRNNYIVNDASDYYDYIMSLVDLGKDTQNAYYVCPDNFHNAHQRVIRAIAIKRERDQYKRLKQEIISYQPKYMRLKSKYFGLCFKNKNIKIRPLKDVYSFYRLAKMHNHCIFQREYYKKEYSVIFCAYVNKTPTEAIEVDIIQGKIIQARGADNMPTKYNNAIKSLVSSNLPKILAIN